MFREPRAQRHTVIYENNGKKVDRYTVSAASERAAEARTTRLFFTLHPGLTSWR
jgi:hypothetical protein